MIDWINITKENIEATSEVLAINDCDDYLIGFLHFDEDAEIFICENDHEVLENVTHFIEIKALNLPNKQ